jgi:putative transposase
MINLYTSLGITKQGHALAVKQKRRELEKEPFYIGFIEEIREIHPGMGLRKIYEQFKPDEIGRDAFISLGLRAGYRISSIQKPMKTTFAVKLHRYVNLLVGKKFTDVNQIWVSDIFYFSMGDKFSYGILIMDVYSRRIIGYSMSDNMRAENNVKALNMALNLRGINNYNSNLIHHSDRGSQYISDEYTDTLDAYGIEVSVCRDVLENAHCERANGTIKNEYLKRYEIPSGEKDMNKYLAKAVDGYNNRLHNSIKMTPIQYEYHLMSVTQEERNILEIFTINKINKNPFQLELVF